MLEEKIELTRKELITIGEAKGFSSMETVKISKELDQLINAFNSLESIPG